MKQVTICLIIGFCILLLGCNDATKVGNKAIKSETVHVKEKSNSEKIIGRWNHISGNEKLEVFEGETAVFQNLKDGTIICDYRFINEETVRFDSKVIFIPVSLILKVDFVDQRLIMSGEKNGKNQYFVYVRANDEEDISSDLVGTSK